jgi:threonine dehydrogenase-like Zn-dependent dehydrogenase
MLFSEGFMKVATLYSFNDIRIEDVPVPEVGLHDALLKTKACGICAGDVMPWDIEKKAPLVPGHEPAGEIVEAGKEITSYKPGGSVFTPAKPGEMLTIDPNDLYFRDMNIITSYACGPTDTADALEIVEEGLVTAEKLVTHRFPIENTAEAFRLMSEAGDSLKIVITL